ncbi:MAG TPA: N-acetylmuramic acid 6-phosphate etherase [Planctomycetota bacterium]|nr:N-acetylmuramic acid 6-phosphate etherase [Planctomycetota bacterium]
MPESALPLTEQVNASSGDLDALAPGEVVALMARAERASVEAFERAAPEVALIAELAAGALRDGRRIVFVGAGTSGRLGALEAAECPPTFGSDPARVRAILAGGPAALAGAVEGAEDRAEDAVAALHAAEVGEGDLVVGVAASGRTPFVRAALVEARARGAKTAFIACDPAVAAERPAPADAVAVLAVGPEVLTGSTRLKAGTATKMALNAITTAAFAANGKVYRNLMVDVRATNAKLEARARRIVRALCGGTDEDAARALAAAGGEVKLAVAMTRLGVARAEAQRALDAAGGCLRRVIGA